MDLVECGVKSENVTMYHFTSSLGNRPTVSPLFCIFTHIATSHLGSATCLGLLGADIGLNFHAEPTAKTSNSSSWEEPETYITDLL